MEPELKIYTIADLRTWLIDNNPPAGLSEHVIAPVRAYAILNNPYVKDEDAVVAAIYEGEELAAFTASFPDMYEGKRIWWASTLWCNPKFQGQGYGLIVIGSLKEVHEPELTFDRWGARETVEIFNCFGYKTIYTSRYVLGDKAINRNTLKGKLAYTLQELKKSLHHTPYSNAWYSLKYSTFVDGEAYTFMLAHRGKDLFFREQKMLNWITRFPFFQGAHLYNRTEKDTIFSSYVEQYEYSVVKVYTEHKLVGVYMLRCNNEIMSIVSIYYQADYKEVVFSSIADHFKKVHAISIVTEDRWLMEYLKKNIYFPRITEEKISLSTTDDMELPQTYGLQLMDGDSFA